MQESQLQIDSAQTIFPIWKILDLNEYNTSPSYIDNLESGNFKVGRVLKAVARKTSPQPLSGIAKLVKVTASDLGLPTNASLDDFYAVYKKFGLKLCRSSVAQVLRGNYEEQPMGEVLWIVSEKMFQSHKESGVCCVWHMPSGKWLSFGCGDGCSWGKWRVRNFTPETQDRAVVPPWLRWLCECPWSLSPTITAIFEI